MPGNSADTGNWCRYDNQPVAPVSDEDDGGGGDGDGDDDKNTIGDVQEYFLIYCRTRVSRSIF